MPKLKFQYFGNLMQTTNSLEETLMLGKIKAQEEKGMTEVQLVKNPPAIWKSGSNPWVGKIPWRRERLPTSVLWPGEFHGFYSL